MNKVPSEYRTALYAVMDVLTELFAQAVADRNEPVINATGTALNAALVATNTALPTPQRNMRGDMRELLKRFEMPLAAIEFDFEFAEAIP